MSKEKSFKYKKLSFIILFIIAAILLFFKLNIIEKVKSSKFIAQKKVENVVEKESGIVEVDVLKIESFANTGKIHATGISYRSTIKILSQNFQEIEYILPPNINEVKKGTLLVKYKTKDLELRAERLEKDVELKSQILVRGEKMDEHNVISKDDLDKIRIDVSNAKGELKEIKYKIEESSKFAPFDCFVENFNLINGSFINNNQEILSVYSKKELFVKANLNINDIQALDDKNLVNKNAVLYFKSQKCQGKIIYLLKNADAFSASVRAVIALENPDDNIIAGEVCRVKIYTGVTERHFLIPEEAVCGDENNLHVFVINKNIAYKTPIVKHGKKGDRVFVSGIQEGSLVVVSGAHRLSNLQKVKI